MKKINNNNHEPFIYTLASLESHTEYETGGYHVDLWQCPGDSRVQKAMNAISESITAVFSCVTDIISLILLNCFGISCVNEHSGTGEEKKGLSNLWAGTAAFDGFWVTSWGGGHDWQWTSSLSKSFGYIMPRIQHETLLTPPLRTDHILQTPIISILIVFT